MESILLVGGAGYIGSHTAKYLRERGYLPIVYDNFVQGHTEAVKWGPLERGDAGDSERLSEVLRKYAPRAAIHFAAYACVGESMAEPAKYYRNNLGETLSLLDTLRSNGVARIVFSSTCAVYGIPARLPITEETPLIPVNPYGGSKVMVERILEDYDRAYGLRSICLRYFNAAGADPECEIGEAHNPETHLIPLALETARGRRGSLKVFDRDYETRDGTCVRDYIHVTDLAQAHYLGLDYLFGEGESLKLNLGTETGSTVMEVLAAAEKASLRKIKVEFAERRPGDPPELVCSADKARRLLGWRPGFSDMDTIMSTAWRWMNSGKWSDGWPKPEGENETRPAGKAIA